MMHGRFGRLVKRFARAQRGTVALMTGLSMLPMLAVAGAAIDFVHASGVQTRLQASLDAAALAAASSASLSESQRIAMAQAVFARNWQDAFTDRFSASATFTFQGGGIVGDASVEVPASFMQLVGIDTMDVDADVTISIPETKKAELALVLDYSFSMTETSGGKVKYVAMKDAAIKLVDDLAAAGKNKVKIGLVPFSHHVWLTLPKAHVAGVKGVGSWTGCTLDRLYPHNISNATPTRKDETKWNQPVVSSHKGCGGYLPRKLVVRPLSDNFDRIAEQLEDMLPYDHTHISLAVEIGWHILSPNAPFTEGVDYSDTKTNKFMVVLTDGRQMEEAFGPGGSRTLSNGEKNLAALCGKAKDEGITMITIAFDLRDKSTRDRLRNCSTDPDKHFFVAEDDDEIARAFDDIKSQIVAKMYVSK